MAASVSAYARFVRGTGVVMHITSQFFNKNQSANLFSWQLVHTFQGTVATP